MVHTRLNKALKFSGEVSREFPLCIRIFLVAFVATSFLLIPQPAVADVTWQQQASRLQNVNASLLDTAPIGEPVRAKLGIEAKAILSFPPKIGSTVGSKTEKVPAAPLQTVPTLQLNHRVIDDSDFRLSYQAWGGYLVPGAQVLFGISSTVSEAIWGAAIIPEWTIGSGVHLYFSTSYQGAHGAVTGPITDPSASDSFRLDTSYISLAPGIWFPDLGVWGSLLVGKKKTQSTFSISIDQTSLSQTDTLSDSPSFPFAAQFSVGWTHRAGYQVALSELLVPRRLLMPRITFSYQYATGGP